MSDKRKHSDNGLIGPEEDSLLGQGDTEIEEGTHPMRNRNTIRKTVSDVKKFVDWLKASNETRPPECIPLKELDEHMASFFSNAKKLDGEEYEPESLKSFQCSINRYLSEKLVAVNVLLDEEFKHSREVLLSKRKELKKRQNKEEPFTPEEIDLLYAKNLLGTGNVRALQNTVFLNNAIYFGLESRKEHVRLKWGEIELKTTDDGAEYLEYVGKTARNKIALTDCRDMILRPVIKSQPGNDRCPVYMYRVFVSRRPKDMNSPDSPFYLSISRVFRLTESCYLSNGLGKNTIGSLVKTMCEEAGITSKKITYSARKKKDPLMVFRSLKFAEQNFESDTKHMNSGQKRHNGVDTYEPETSTAEKVSRILQQRGDLETGHATVIIPVTSRQLEHKCSCSQDAPNSEQANTDHHFPVEVKIESGVDDENGNPGFTVVTRTANSGFNRESLNSPCGHRSRTDSDTRQQPMTFSSSQLPKQPYTYSLLAPSISNDIAKLESERLAVEQERLRVAKERLETEKELLQIEQERVCLERRRLHHMNGL